MYAVRCPGLTHTPLDIAHDGVGITVHANKAVLASHITFSLLHNSYKPWFCKALATASLNIRHTSKYALSSSMYPSMYRSYRR